MSSIASHRDGAGRLSKASLNAIPSIGPHQMYAAAALGRARGVTQRHAPAVVYDDMQAVELGRGDVPPVPFRNSHRLVCSSLTSRYSRARAVTGCASPFIPANAPGSRPSVGNTLTDQHVYQCASDRLHHHRSFRNPSSFDGSRTIGKAFAKWTKTNSQSVKK